MPPRPAAFAMNLGQNGSAENFGEVVWETTDTIRIAIYDERLEKTGELRDLPKQSAKLFDSADAMQLAVRTAGNVILEDGREVSLDRAKEWMKACGCPVGTIIERFSNWCVTSDGIHCLQCPYFIEKERLHEADWLDHMKEKSWVNWLDFSRAIEAARKLFPKKR